MHHLIFEKKYVSRKLTWFPSVSSENARTIDEIRALDPPDGWEAELLDEVARNDLVKTYWITETGRMLGKWEFSDDDVREIGARFEHFARTTEDQEVRVVGVPQRGTRREIRVASDDIEIRVGTLSRGPVLFDYFPRQRISEIIRPMGRNHSPGTVARIFATHGAWVSDLDVATSFCFWIGDRVHDVWGRLRRQTYIGSQTTIVAATRVSGGGWFVLQVDARKDFFDQFGSK